MNSIFWNGTITEFGLGMISVSRDYIVVVAETADAAESAAMKHYGFKSGDQYRWFGEFTRVPDRAQLTCQPGFVFNRGKSWREGRAEVLQGVDVVTHGDIWEDWPGGF